MEPGTVYTTLTRLQQRSWIEALPAEDTRRPYRLSGAGTAALCAQLGKLEHVTAAGLKRLGLVGAFPVRDR